ncbi:hypothetical protein PR048_008911 [Dryococelus australis]|uniref:Uncharacterized protein n=1 Tax=Dryococelus australis TaxID=614101 RepID=A0ABQ9HYF8_9NEOP|nr:hypothetical protein PR048_008911 [Dryococelus australis]
MPGLPTHAITTGTPDIAPSKFQNRSQRKLPFSRTLSSTFQEKRGLEDANRTTAYPAEGKRQDNSLASSIHHMRHYVNSVPSGAQSHVHTNGKAALQLRECFALRGDVARGDVGVTLPSASPRTIQVSARANVADIAGGVLVFPGCCCYLIVWAHTSAQVSLPSGDTGAPRLDVSSSKPLQHHQHPGKTSTPPAMSATFARAETWIVLGEADGSVTPTSPVKLLLVTTWRGLDVSEALSIEVLRVDGGEAMREWGSAGMKGRVRRDIPEKTLPTSGIVRHDSLLRKCGSAPAGD